jgi:hypothetical protein
VGFGWSRPSTAAGSWRRRVGRIGSKRRGAHPGDGAGQITPCRRVLVSAGPRVSDLARSRRAGKSGDAAAETAKAEELRAARTEREQRQAEQAEHDHAEQLAAALDRVRQDQALAAHAGGTGAAAPLPPGARQGPRPGCPADQPLALAAQRQEAGSLLAAVPRRAAVLGRRGYRWSARSRYGACTPRSRRRLAPHPTWSPRRSGTARRPSPTPTTLMVPRRGAREPGG